MSAPIKAAAAAVVFLLAACASAQSERDTNYLGSALSKLSAAVDATVRYDKPAEDVDEPTLLQLAIAQDPSLLQPFNGMTLRIRREGQASAVLICEAPQGKALLEDAGCTARMDSHRWRDETACQFTLDLSATCAQ